MSEHMNYDDVKEIKNDIKSLTTSFHSLDKGMTELKIIIQMMGNVREMAIETQESSKSAHKRIDDHEEVHKEDIEEVKQSVKDIKGGFTKLQYYFWGAVITCSVGLIFKSF